MFLAGAVRFMQVSEPNIMREGRTGRSEGDAPVTLKACIHSVLCTKLFDARSLSRCEVYRDAVQSSSGV